MIVGHGLDARADLAVADDSDRHPQARRGLVPAAQSRASSRSRCRSSWRSCVSLLRPVPAEERRFARARAAAAPWLSSRAYALASSLPSVVVAVLGDRRRGRRVRAASLPAPGSETYEQMTRAFYHGLAALEVGLLDDARQQFTSATRLVPRGAGVVGEPGAGAAAARRAGRGREPIERALALAPDNSDIVLLAGAHGNGARPSGRGGRAACAGRSLLDARGLRARFALAEELPRPGTPEADAEAQALLDELATRAPANLAILLERARLAAKLRDRAAASRVGRCDRPRRGVVAGSGAGAVRGRCRRPRPTASFDDAAARHDDPAQRAGAGAGVLGEPGGGADAGGADCRAVRSLPRARVAAGDAVGAGHGAHVYGGAVGARWRADRRRARVSAERRRRARARCGGRRRRSAHRWCAAARGRCRCATPDNPAPARDSVAALDWNHDFRTDLALCGPGGVQLLLQGEDGTFADVTARPSAGDASDLRLRGRVAGRRRDGRRPRSRRRRPRTARRSCCATTATARGRRTSRLPARSARAAFAWADLDRDADPDAVFVDGAGALRVLRQPAGRRVRARAEPPAPARRRGRRPSPTSTPTARSTSSRSTRMGVVAVTSGRARRGRRARSRDGTVLRAGAGAYRAASPPISTTTARSI